MTAPVRWGVLGATSFIHRAALAPAFADSAEAELVASASRTGPDHGGGGARRYADYAEVLTDPDVEAVYLPLPNHLHEPWTVAAAEAGKHVLCEKPLAPDAAGARRMAAACDAAGVVLAEAYMTPFHPRSARWRALVDDGWLGTPLHGTARFTFPHGDPDDYRWRADAGGGALLDVGIYCLEPLLHAAGWQPGDEPPAVTAHARTTAGGVDATCTAWLAFPSGFTATLCCSFDAPEGQTLELVGTAGTLRVEPAFTPTADDRTISATRRDGTTTAIDTGGDAMYRLMVDHVSRVIRGQEQLRRSPDDAVALAEVLDLLRRAAQHPAARPSATPTKETTT